MKENQKEITIADLKKGDLFKKKATEKTVFEKGFYVRESKRFECTDISDTNHFQHLKPETIIIPLSK